MKAARFILDAFKQEGFEHVFMVPGGLLDSFLTEFGDEASGVEAVVAAHEGGAAYMADGYARASGAFGICLGIGGPGVANMLCPLAAASADHSPVLVIAGQVQTDWEGRGAFQDASPGGLNDIEMMRPIVGYVEEVRLAESIPHHLHEAMRSMLGYVRGPVCITIPKQIQNTEVTGEYRPLSESMTKAPRFVVEGGVREATKLLDGSTRIAILAGNGARQSVATAELTAFAEAYSIPVATTLRAKGVFPEDHPLSMGVFGYAGSRHATKALLGYDGVDGGQDDVGEADRLEVLLVLGSSLNQRDTMVWSEGLRPKNGLIQVDVNPSTFGRNFPVDRAVTGDVRTALRSLQNRLLETDTVVHESLAESKEQREEWIAGIRDLPRFYDIETRTEDRHDNGIHPARVIADLQTAAAEFCDEEPVLLIDSGAHRAFAGHHWQSSEPGRYLSSTTLAPMGWAIPAAIGAKLARPDLPCVAITGDGCMLMNGMEIQTAAHRNLHIIFLISNNSALGNVWLRAHDSESGRRITELTTHDWVGFARSLGADGERVDDPSDLVAAYSRAFAATGPYVLDIRTDRTATTPITPWRARTSLPGIGPEDLADHGQPAAFLGYADA